MGESTFEFSVNERRRHIGRCGRQMSGPELMEIQDLAKLTQHSDAAHFGAAAKLDVGGHRERITSQAGAMQMLLESTCVARPVPRKEFTQSDNAMKAYWEEWGNLEAKETWDWDSLVVR